ncbi:MAG: pyridoxal phosphate-dependent aminotransferase family protein [Saprospiraceae bacterium]|nr:pyridoxal phosphate-dependent aminotransferase family protein [Saprospiraceae bacterium]
MTTTIIDHLPSRILHINGIEHLFFSGTSYLGMGHQAQFRAALMEGMVQYGTVFSASRNNNLQLKIYEEAENFIAHWAGSEAALTVSSGLAAGQLAVQYLSNQRIILAPSTHPAIWQPNAPPQYLGQNFAEFSERIIEVAHETTESLTIATNAIDPLRGENIDFSWVKNLPKDKNITLLLDDSHCIGITGTEGGGIFSKIKNDIGSDSQVRLIVIASLAKAVGIPGGVILSDSNTIATIRQMPLFVGASPIVPAYLFAFLKAQPVYNLARERLQMNIKQFKNSIQPSTHLAISSLPNYPVFFTSQSKLFSFLLNHKILISSFSYPKPTDPPLTRIILSALHSEADIAFLVEKLNHLNTIV